LRAGQSRFIGRSQTELAVFLRRSGQEKQFEVILEYFSRQDSIKRELDEFINTPVEKLDDLFSFGFNAEGRRDAKQRSFRDVDAKEPLITLEDVIHETPGSVANPELSKVTVWISKPSSVAK
jgi:hypothetical protein